MRWLNYAIVVSATVEVDETSVEVPSVDETSVDAVSVDEASEEEDDASVVPSVVVAGGLIVFLIKSIIAGFDTSMKMAGLA